MIEFLRDLIDFSHLRLALLILNDLIEDRLVHVVSKDAIDFEVLRQNDALALNLRFQGLEEFVVDSVLSGFFLPSILLFELHILLCVHTSEEFRGIEVDWGFDHISFLFFFFLTAEIWRAWLISIFSCPSTWVLSRGFASMASAIAVITTTSIALLFWLFAEILFRNIFLAEHFFFSLFVAPLFLTIFITIVFFPVLVILRLFSAVIIIRVFLVVVLSIFLAFFAVLIVFLIFFAVLVAIFKSVVVPNERFRLILG